MKNYKVESVSWLLRKYHIKINDTRRVATRMPSDFNFNNGNFVDFTYDQRQRFVDVIKLEIEEDDLVAIADELSHRDARLAEYDRFLVSEYKEKQARASNHILKNAYEKYTTLLALYGKS